MDTCAIADLDEWLRDRKKIQGLLHQHLLRSQLPMKHQAYKKRTERELQVGERIYLKLQPYVQASLAPRANQKLSFRYYEPYQIEQRVGTVAYKLKLP